MSLVFQSPLMVHAAHSHGDACYENGCSKHAHTSSCESLSKTPVSGATAKTCNTCNGHICNSIIKQTQVNTSTGQYGSGYFSLYCPTCKEVVCTGGEWYSNPGGSKYEPPSYGGRCRNASIRCMNTVTVEWDYTFYDSDWCSSCNLHEYATMWVECSSCGYKEYLQIYESCGKDADIIAQKQSQGYIWTTWLHSYVGTKRQCNGSSKKCTNCTQGKQYLTFKCGKNISDYYTSSGVIASASCNKVVTNITFK